VDEYTTLIKGTWYSNTINSSSQCFKVAVTNGTTYTLSWWDKKASSNYTAYIQICVYADASETTALWNGYWYASGSSTGVRTKTFTATSSTAYIVVMPYTSYGTYQMKVD
jgi:hypothetical protein